MKKILLVSIILGFGIILVGKFSSNNKVYAVSGCCLERDSDNGSWYNSGKSIKECEDANKNDNDDIFEEAGKIWWDVSC